MRHKRMEFDKERMQAMVLEREAEYGELFPCDFVDSKGIVKYQSSSRHKKDQIIHETRHVTSINPKILQPLVTEDWGVIQGSASLQGFAEFVLTKTEMRFDVDGILRDEIIHSKVDDFMNILNNEGSKDEEIEKAFFLLMDRIAKTMNWIFFRVYETSTLVGGLVTFPSDKYDKDTCPAIAVSPNFLLSDSSRSKKFSISASNSSNSHQAMTEAIFAGIGLKTLASLALSPKTISVLWFNELTLQGDFQINRFTQSDRQSLIKLAFYCLLLIAEPRSTTGCSILKTINFAHVNKNPEFPNSINSWEHVRLIRNNGSVLKVTRLDTSLTVSKDLIIR